MTKKVEKTIREPKMYGGVWKVFRGCWGVSLENISLVRIIPASEIEAGQIKTLEAMYTKKKAITESEGTKKAKMNEADGLRYFEEQKGTGLAEARKLFMLAEAKGYGEIAKELNVTEKQVIYTMAKWQEAVATNSKFFFESSEASLVAKITGILSAVK